MRRFNQSARDDEKVAIQPAASRELFFGVEALRGFAALMIFLRHAEDFTGVEFKSAHLAVDLFFVLSGFVLAHAYDRRFTAGLSPARFMLQRLIRLYPLYLMGLGLGLAAVLFARFGNGDTEWSLRALVKAAALNGLFLPAPSPRGQPFELDLPAWSLFLELCVCLAFALSWRRLGVRSLLWVALASGATVVFCVFRYRTLSIGWDWTTFWAGFPRVFYSFPVGVLIYRYLPHDRLRMAAWIPPVLLVGLLSIQMGRFQPVYEAVCALVLLPGLAILAVRTEPIGASKVLFGWLGLVSYALYVFHVPVIVLLDQLMIWLGRPPRTVGAAGTLLLLAVLLAVCWLVDRHVDIPLRRAARGRLDRALRPTGWSEAGAAGRVPFPPKE